VAELSAVSAHVAAGLDGVMLGRAAYHRPALLAELERALIDPAWRIPEPWQVMERLVPYACAQVQRGVRLHSITRHLHGLMAGCAGARAWRRFLSDVASRPDAAPESLFSALSSLEKGVAA
jgi:tRNA-dihydrouridine synthase A